MKITSFLCSMSAAQNDIYKAIERLVGQLDSKQFALAGVELGRVIELANKLSDVSRLATDALWDEVQNQ